MSLINSHMVKDNPSRDLNILYHWDPDFSPRMLYTAQTQTMELFSRRRWRLVSALLPNKFGYCRLCIASRYCFGISSPLSCPAPHPNPLSHSAPPRTWLKKHVIVFFAHWHTRVCIHFREMRFIYCLDSIQSRVSECPFSRKSMSNKYP